ncbi:MAG: Tat pathway signal protein [Micromonosporaceae bacterium]
MARPGNVHLREAIESSGCSYDTIARAVRQVAAEAGDAGLRTNRSAVAHWVAGTRPEPATARYLAEALTRRLGRVVTVDELGLEATALSLPDWNVDALASLADLGRTDVQLERRHVLEAAAYSVAALALPGSSWWERMAARHTDRDKGVRTVGRGDLAAVREMTAMFSRIDQRHGGGHGRTALAQYLTSDVARYLRGTYADERVRNAMFSAASELAYLAGWMAFDNSEHAVAQHYFTVAVKLAAEAADPAMAGHILRAMAHQATDLGHPRQGLELAVASMDGQRYTLACPRERALLGVVYAKALGAAGDKRAAATALLKAEDNLAAATPDDEEPARVFFFGEASLAHETACTLRDTGDLDGALREFKRSVRTRKATTFTRTHAVTLGYLGAVHARAGNLEKACATWSKSLDAMDGIHSGRARQVVREMRSALSPFKGRGATTATELDHRAAAYLAAAS